MAGFTGGRPTVAALTVILAVSCTWVWARSTSSGGSPAAQLLTTPTLTLDTQRPGSVFSRGAVGFSTEAGELARRRLSGERPSLVRLMRMLGPSVLRIGGNSVDRSWWTSKGEPAPAWATATITPRDLAILHGLIRATGWRVLLGVNLGHFEPARAADEARVAQQRLGSGLLGVELGNEPDYYAPQYRPAGYNVAAYLRDAEAYAGALKAQAPDIAILGPASTQTSSLLSQLGGAGQMFSELTQHFYASSTCPGKPPVVAPSVSGLFSAAERQLEERVLAMLAVAAAAAGRPTRIGETNDTACMASAAISPVFASALWALDWTLRASSSGVSGVSFHGNLGGVCGANPESPICAAGPDAALRGELSPQPEYSGLLAASRLEGGRFVPTSITASTPPANLTSWATLAHDGTLRVALENLATVGAPQAVLIPMFGYTATEEPLEAPSPTARQDVLLAGARVTGRGWRSKPKRIRHRRTLRVEIPAASALILTLRPLHRS
ncbi:MAG: hypothetical protein H0X28_00195 [Solirubrobacterales bacterium]|nr:hypothetical protein [Solirubrobacterales bacterium]